MPSCQRPRRRLLPIALVTVLALAAPAAAEVYDSSHMVLLAHKNLFAGYSDLWGFVGTNGHEYIIQHTLSGTAWWDVQDPSHPVLVKTIAGPSSQWRDAFVIGNYAYIGTEGGGGIQIVDISDPTNPTLVNTYSATVGNSHTVFGDVARKLLFVMGGNSGGANGGLQVLDCTDPVNLVEIGHWTSQYVHDGSLDGNTFHACLIYVGRVRLIDLTNPAVPTSLGNAFNDPVGGVHTSWPLGDHIHLAMTEETNGGHLDILDISNPSAITLTTFDNPAPSTSAHNCHVQGNRLFVAWYTRGTRVYDVTNPASISEIGYFDTYYQPASATYEGNWGVYPHLPSGIVASNDITNGLYITQYDANAGKIEGTISSSAGGVINGATVTYAAYDLDETTDATGAYRYPVHPGANQKVRASAYAHAPDSVTVTVAPNGTTTANITLQKYPTGGIVGRITNASTGLPIQAVELSLAGTPLTAVTDVNGNYSLPGIPTIPTTNFQLNVLRYGYVVPRPFPITIVAGTNVTKDVQLTPAATYVDFSAPTGWTVQSDPQTTSGIWVFAEPYGTYSGGVPVQTEYDHTLDPENQCAVTGNLASGGIGDDDVDGGATRLLSPVYDMSGMTTPHAFFYRWYAVNDTQDAWRVEATANGGASWTTLDTTVNNEAFWKPVDVNLTGLLPSFAAVQFRFTASDSAPGQIVEAALDDFTLYDAGGGLGAVGVAIQHGENTPLDLGQNFPNPFGGETAIDFATPAKGFVSLNVYDVRGARVASVIDGRELDAGRHHATWDGRDRGGKRAAAGLYFYELRTKDGVLTKKMVRIAP